MKKSSVSSQREKLRQVSVDSITMTEELAAELALPNRDDSEIDLTDPELPEITDWNTAARGKFFRPIKKAISLRVDADVLAWFKAQGTPYQRRMNAVLREYMLRHGEDRL